MALIFFVSIGMFGVAVGLAYQRYLRFHGLKELYSSGGFKETSKNLGEFIQKQAESARHKFSTLPLGSFSVEMKTAEGAGGAQAAEIEIVIEFDSKETRYYAEDNMAKLRDQITGVLLPQEREELMGSEGKKRLKKKITDQINSWLPEGRVVELFFSDLILN